MTHVEQGFKDLCMVIRVKVENQMPMVQDGEDLE